MLYTQLATWKQFEQVKQVNRVSGERLRKKNLSAIRHRGVTRSKVFALFFLQCATFEKRIKTRPHSSSANTRTDNTCSECTLGPVSIAKRQKEKNGREKSIGVIFNSDCQREEDPSRREHFENAEWVFDSVGLSLHELNYRKCVPSVAHDLANIARTLSRARKFDLLPPHAFSEKVFSTRLFFSVTC